MKISCCSDQHWTDRKPKNRTDSYFTTVMGKLKQEYEIAKEEGCSFIIFPGDLFDSFKESHFVVQSIIYLMNSYPDISALCVSGQHDRKFHNDDLSGTALETLIAAGCVTLLTDDPYIYNTVAFYGANWAEEIPEIVTPAKLNVLVIHKMILGDERLWEAQEGGTWANHILLKTKYDLVVSGDNHQQFTVSKKKRHLVNLGSMVRSNISQLNHKPAVVVYDTESKEIDIIDLDVRPFQEVMMVERAEKEKERNLALEAFVHSLKDTITPEMIEQARRLGIDPKELKGHTSKLDFVEALKTYIEKNEIPESVSSIIKECLE